MNITVAELAGLIGGELSGRPDTMVLGVADITDSAEGAVVLASDDRFFVSAVESGAACIVAGPNSPVLDGKNVIRVAEPAVAFVKVLEFFRGDDCRPAVGIAPGAVVEPDAEIGAEVALGANCYIGHGASIGEGCVVFPNVYIGGGVKVGRGCCFYPGVVIYPNCHIGDRVILHAGVVIGADGFGYIPGETGLMKIPHAGIVELEDDVEIGANSTVDRAKFGATIICEGTKIDNLVHVAHNVKIGAHSVVVALTGIAGSVEMGSGVTLAAQVGVKDHVRIGNGAIVAARAGVIGDVAEGSVVSGFPARDHCLEKRAQAARLRLPEMLERLRALEREVHELRGKSRSGEDDDTHR